MDMSVPHNCVCLVSRIACSTSGSKPASDRVRNHSVHSCASRVVYLPVYPMLNLLDTKIKGARSVFDIPEGKGVLSIHTFASCSANFLNMLAYILRSRSLCSLAFFWHMEICSRAALFWGLTSSTFSKSPLADSNSFMSSWASPLLYKPFSLALSSPRA